MEIILQASLVVVSVCLAGAVFVRRAVARADSRIHLDPVSRGWLSEQRVRTRQQEWVC
jgi:hypothetical protein